MDFQSILPTVDYPWEPMPYRKRVLLSDCCNYEVRSSWIENTDIGCFVCANCREVCSVFDIPIEDRIKFPIKNDRAIPHYVWSNIEVDEDGEVVNVWDDEDDLGAWRNISTYPQAPEAGQEYWTLNNKYCMCKLFYEPVSWLKANITHWMPIRPDKY